MQALRRAVDKALAQKALRAAALPATPEADVDEADNAVDQADHPVDEVIAPAASTAAGSSSTSTSASTSSWTINHEIEQPAAKEAPPEPQPAAIPAPAVESTAPEKVQEEEEFDPQSIMAAALAEREARKAAQQSTTPRDVPRNSQQGAPQPAPEASSTNATATETPPERPVMDAFEMLLASSPSATQVGAGPATEDDSPATNHSALELKGAQSILAANKANEPAAETDPTTNDRQRDEEPEDTADAPHQRSLRNWFSPKPAPPEPSDDTN